MILDLLVSTQDRDPTSGFWYGPVGGPTRAGVAINEQIAMTYSACWAATCLLASAGAGIPLNVYQASGKRNTLALGERIYTMLHDAPNPQMSSMMWRATKINQQVNYGNCFSEIERDNYGDILNLWPIHASRVTLVDDGDTLYYEIKSSNGPPDYLPYEDVFHVPSVMSDDGRWGKGVITAARESIGHAIATERYGSGWFGSGGSLKAVLTHPKTLDKEARANLRKEWSEIYDNPNAVNKTAILMEGMAYQSIATTPENSQFIASRQHNIEEVARWYGVPPHLIGHLLRSTYSNIEHQGIEFVKYSLMRWIRVWEQEIWRKLLTPAQQKAGFYAKFNVDALERADLQNRTQALKEQFFNGEISINEWRDLEDRDPIGPLGDVHFVQSAMVPLEIAVEGPQEPDPPQSKLPPADEGDTESAAVEALRSEYARREAEFRQRNQAAAVRMMEQVVGRMLTKEANEARKAIKKPESFAAWALKFYESASASFSAELRPAAEAYLLACGECDSARLDCFVDTQVSLHISASKLDFAAIGDSESLEVLLSNWKNNRTKVQL